MGGGWRSKGGRLGKAPSCGGETGTAEHEDPWRLVNTPTLALPYSLPDLSVLLRAPAPFFFFFTPLSAPPVFAGSCFPLPLCLVANRSGTRSTRRKERNAQRRTERFSIFVKVTLPVAQFPFPHQHPVLVQKRRRLLWNQGHRASLAKVPPGCGIETGKRQRLVQNGKAGEIGNGEMRSGLSKGQKRGKSSKAPSCGGETGTAEHEDLRRLVNTPASP